MDVVGVHVAQLQPDYEGLSLFRKIEITRYAAEHDRQVEIRAQIVKEPVHIIAHARNLVAAPAFQISHWLVSSCGNLSINVIVCLHGRFYPRTIDGKKTRV